MPKIPISTARESLQKIDTGVERRLLYLAAGDDVGCSVGLFWRKCESFYLVDPMYKRRDAEGPILTALSEGRARYMAGMRILSEHREEGWWEGVHPGRRYHVWRRGQDGAPRKRLCFVGSGSNAWLAATPNTRYNVAINKDYAGIVGSADQEYPYHSVWARLNHNGIFCETLGAGRASEEYGFARYRFRGFTHLWEVRTDTDTQIGFARGFHLFQKTTDGGIAFYRRQEDLLGRIEAAVQATFNPFLEAYDFSMTVIEGNAGYGGLHTLMERASSSTWAALSRSEEFATWLVGAVGARMRSDGYTVPLRRELVVACTGALRLESWGAFK